MHIAENYSAKRSLKIIRIRRSIRNLRDWLYILLLIASIVFSIYVINKKYNRLNSSSRFIAKIFTNHILYGLNFIDNALMTFSHVKINKLQYVNQVDIENIIKKSNNIGQNESRMRFIKLEIEKVPFIKNVTMIRKIDRSLQININEINIVGMMRDVDSGIWYFIDDSGNNLLYKNQDISQYSFPLIDKASLDDMESYHTMYKNLTNCPIVMNNIIKYENISSRRWDVLMKNGVKILLPNEFDDNTIALLCDIIKNKLPVTQQNSNFEYLDARVRGRFYYKLKNEQ